MKTIALDITPLLLKQWGGVSWYSFYLTEGLVTYAARGELRVVLFYNQRRLLSDRIIALLTKWRREPNVSIAGYRIPNKILNLSMRFLKFPYIDELIEVRIKPTRIDYLIIPNLSFIALTTKTPYIAVCHDLSYEIFPEFFTVHQRLWHRLVSPQQFYEKAHRVITVSDNTKQDLVDLYGIDPAHIDVIYPGIDHALFYPRDDTRAALKKYNLPDDFILSVGTLEPRKNYETLLEAFDMLASPSHLLIVGSEGWKYDRIYRFLNRMKHKPRVQFLFNVSREDLPFLYSAARLFIYPSFYEGFGFPPLEAAACGTPVITSHGSSLPEIMEDAVLYVDPFNIADLARAMERVLNDRKLSDIMREKGLQIAKKFTTWNATIKKLCDILN